jgi:xanthine/CO dehydrogenase XdhC/CoxF family maturation factor
LEIGAVTPEEIAVSIVAEMIARKRNVEVGGASKKLMQAQPSADLKATESN